MFTNNTILKKIKDNKITFILFLVLFIIGLFTFKDYGVSTDEQMQKEHLLQNYYEYVKLFENITHTKNNSIKNAYEYKKLNMEGINSYIYKYYGVGIQFPLILIEQITNFKLDISIYYYIRHLYTFIIYFISIIYFYLMLNRYILKNQKYSILGTMFLVLSPRIYGDSFYNIKDLVFMSLCIINCYYCLKLLNTNRDNIKDIIKLSLITALTINSRIIGGFIIFLFFIMKFLINTKDIRKVLLSFIKIIIFTYGFYFIMTPAMWYSPFTYIIDSIGFFYNYEDPYSHIVNLCYYLGKWIYSNELPWHYVPVWIFVTTPIVYMIFFLIGNIKNINDIIKRRINLNIMFLNIILFVILLFFIIFKPTLYGGWRHLYFLYPLIIVDSILGVKFLLDKCLKIRKLIIFIIIINCFVLIIWMIKNHPYQYNYFDLTFKDYYVNNFENDYWKLSYTEALKYILKKDKRDKIKVRSNHNLCCDRILEQKDRKRVYLNAPNIDFSSKDNDYYDYIIGFHIDSKDYSELYYKEINGVRLYTIYKHKK